MKKILLALATITLLVGCDLSSISQDGTKNDINKQIDVGNNLATNQPTPTDIDYSLERYNLIRRAYWVNGQREKAISLPCSITKPLGYCYLFSMGQCLGQFIVDGKVSSLNSFLTSDYYTQLICGHSLPARQHSSTNTYTIELPDVDGSYGDNDNGIFFFTIDGKYIEWNGEYLYSDIPFNVKETILYA